MCHVRNTLIVTVPVMIANKTSTLISTFKMCVGAAGELSDEGSQSEKSQSGEKRCSDSSRREISNTEKLLRYIFLDAKYYLIKSSNHENVALAQARGVWSSPPQNEARLNRAFRVCVIAHSWHSFSFKFLICDTYVSFWQHVITVYVLNHIYIVDHEECKVVMKLLSNDNALIDY